MLHHLGAQPCLDEKFFRACVSAFAAVNNFLLSSSAPLPAKAPEYGSFFSGRPRNNRIVIMGPSRKDPFKKHRHDKSFEVREGIGAAIVDCEELW